MRNVYMIIAVNNGILLSVKHFETFRKGSCWHSTDPLKIWKTVCIRRPSYRAFFGIGCSRTCGEGIFPWLRVRTSQYVGPKFAFWAALGPNYGWQCGCCYRCYFLPYFLRPFSRLWHPLNAFCCVSSSDFTMAAVGAVQEYVNIFIKELLDFHHECVWIKLVK